MNNPKWSAKYAWGAIFLLLSVVVGSVIFSIATDSSNTSTGKPTPQPHSTASTIIATPAQATPTAQQTSQLMFFDEFTDNTRGWATGNGSGYIRTINDGTLTLSDTNHESLVESVPVSTLFSDFALTTTFTLTGGDKNDSVGIFLRGDSNLDHDYRIDIYGDSTYTISKESLDEDNQQIIKTLVDHTQTPWLRELRKSNVLTVIMEGPEMVLILNGAVIKSIADTDYTHGQIALFVENGPTSDGVTANFSSVVISTAPEQLPVPSPTPV
jgi:hypothetical protein